MYNNGIYTVYIIYIYNVNGFKYSERSAVGYDIITMYYLYVQNNKSRRGQNNIIILYVRFGVFPLQAASVNGGQAESNNNNNNWNEEEGA